MAGIFAYVMAITIMSIRLRACGETIIAHAYYALARLTCDAIAAYRVKFMVDSMHIDPTLHTACLRVDPKCIDQLLKIGSIKAWL